MMLAQGNAAVADPATDLAQQPERPGASEAVRPKAAAKALPLDLRIVAGFHNGAARALERREVLMIGNAADCDVILADAGVGRHHCLIARNGNKLSVRAVDSALSIDGQEVAPGEPLKIRPGSRISVGDAVITVVKSDGQAGDNDWAASASASAAEAAASIARTWQGAPWWATVLLAVTVIGAVLWTARQFWFVDHGPLEAPLPAVDAVVKSMGMGEVAVQEKPNGTLLVQGVVPDARSETELKSKLQDQAPNAVVQVRQGNAVAGDVSEILRLKGIDASASYEGNGQVRVEGHLGNEGALSSAIQSRAMRDIQGLKKIVAVNLDTQARRQPPASKRITSVSNGADPHVVTADGSRYYVGAQLPGGGQLVAIEGNEVVVGEGGDKRHKLAVGSLLGGK